MANTKYIISLVDQVTRTAKTIGRSLNGITAQAKRADSAISSMSLLMAGAAVAGVFKLGAELESTRIIFNTLTQSVEKGTALFEGLTKFANETPFSNTALNKNAQTLLAFGETADSVIGTLKMLGEISVGDQEKLGSLTLAFAQAQATGKLMGQDLNQMINAGFNPLQEISRVTGKSLGFLKDQMSKGAISADMLRAAFESASGPGGRFNGMIDLMSQSMAGKWSTALGKGKFAIAEFGLSLKDIFLPALDRAIETIDRLSGFMTQNADAVLNWAKALATIVPALVLAIGFIKIFNLVAMANPYALIIVGIAALIAFIYKLSTNFNEMTKKIDEFFDSAGLLWIPLQALYEIIRDIVGIFKAFKADGFVGGMKQIGKSILSWVILPFEKILNALASFGIGVEAAKKLASFRSTLKFVEEEKPDEAVKIAAKAAEEEKKKEKFIYKFDEPTKEEKEKKLRAEGVVSGGIKTFNINIAGITGINTLSTTNIQEGATQTARAVTDALLEALSDIKNVG